MTESMNVPIEEFVLKMVCHKCGAEYPREREHQCNWQTFVGKRALVVDQYLCPNENRMPEVVHEVEIGEVSPSGNYVRFYWLIYSNDMPAWNYKDRYRLVELLNKRVNVTEIER